MSKTPAWFSEETVGHGFIGDRTRLHVCTIAAIAPNVLRMNALCEASEPTTITHPLLDAEDEGSCRDWWTSKIRVTVGEHIDNSLKGGLAKPRVCGDCKAIYDGSL